MNLNKEDLDIFKVNLYLAATPESGASSKYYLAVSLLTSFTQIWIAFSSTSDLVLFKQDQEQRHNVTITNVVRNVQRTCSAESTCSYTSGIQEWVHLNVRHQNRSIMKHPPVQEDQTGEDISHNRKSHKEAYGWVKKWHFCCLRFVLVSCVCRFFCLVGWFLVCCWLVGLGFFVSFFLVFVLTELTHQSTLPGNTVYPSSPEALYVTIHTFQRRAKSSKRNYEMDAETIRSVQRCYARGQNCPTLKMTESNFIALTGSLIVFLLSWHIQRTKLEKLIYFFFPFIFPLHFCKHSALIKNTPINKHSPSEANTDYSVWQLYNLSSPVIKFVCG